MIDHVFNKRIDKQIRNNSDISTYTLSEEEMQKYNKIKPFERIIASCGYNKVEKDKFKDKKNGYSAAMYKPSLKNYA